MDFRRSKTRIRFRGRTPKAEDVIGRELLLGVWGLHVGSDVHYAGQYVHYCKDLLSSLEDHALAEVNRNDIIQLVEIVQANGHQSVQEVENAIRASNLPWMSSSTNDEAIRSALDFALRLWLFVQPDLSNNALSLRDVVSRSLPQLKQLGPPGYLSPDFSAKSLTRKGGIKLEYTSYLPHHLTFVGKGRLRVFRHVSALRKSSRSEGNVLYPPGFLVETESTLSLLFPPANFETSKRTRRIAEKYDVDIEARIESAVESGARIDLSNYPYWYERLREVQKAYDDARPRSLKQWWFDRRNRFEWATFWTAVVVFILTLVFGLIASITGIMQVYAAFQALY